MHIDHKFYSQQKTFDDSIPKKNLRILDNYELKNTNPYKDSVYETSNTIPKKVMSVKRNKT